MERLQMAVTDGASSPGQDVGQEQALRVQQSPSGLSCGSGDRRRWFRSCVGRFPTGVAVVTFEGTAGPQGVTVSSFISVSLDPLLVLVSIARSARAHQALLGRPFVVNILGAEQESLARMFAGQGPLVPISWDLGGVAPRLADPLAHVDCLPWQNHAAGDHTLFLGEVVDFDLRQGDPLAFSHGGFTALVDPVLGLEHLI